MTLTKRILREMLASADRNQLNEDEVAEVLENQINIFADAQGILERMEFIIATSLRAKAEGWHAALTQEVSSAWTVRERVLATAARSVEFDSAPASRDMPGFRAAMKEIAERLVSAVKRFDEATFDEATPDEAMSN